MLNLIIIFTGVHVQHITFNAKLIHYFIKLFSVMNDVCIVS